jgi:hypothetical protein
MFPEKCRHGAFWLFMVHEQKSLSRLDTRRFVP